jgi:hypothetical protein
MIKQLTLPLILLSLSCTTLLAQKKQPPPQKSPYAITWSQTFGGSGLDIGFSICEYDTSEILTANYTYSNDGTITTPVHGNADWWAMKFTHSTTPQLVWSYTYGGSQYDKNRQITPSYNHKSYALFGSTHSEDGDIDKSQLLGKSNDSWWLVKINEAGTILQQKLFVNLGAGDNGGRALLPTSDNGYILLGWSSSQGGDFTGNYSNFGKYSLDGWLFKVDSNFNIQWKNHYGGTGADAPIRIIRAGNYYYITGVTSSNDYDFAGQNHDSLPGIPSGDFGVWKIDTMGNVIWAKSPGGSSLEFPFDIHADWDGNIVCAGFTESHDGDVTGYHGGPKDGWIFKLNAADGSIMWERTLGGSKSDAIKRIVPMPDHGYTLLCTSSSKDGDAAGAGNHGSKDVWLVRMDSNRNVMYSKMFGGSAVEEALDIQEFPGQGWIILCSANSKDGDLAGIPGCTTPTSGQDDWLFFVTDSSLFNSNSSQKFQPNVMQMAEAMNPTSVIVYPSVTSGPFSIQSAVPVSKGYTIRVVDVSGKEVWSKVITTINAPVNQNIDLSKNAKGTYFVQIQFADGKKQTQKVVVQ